MMYVHNFNKIKRIKLFPYYILICMYYIPGQKEARRGAGAEMCNYKRDQSWVRSPFEEIKFSPKPSKLLCAEYSVKLIYFFII